MTPDSIPAAPAPQQQRRRGPAIGHPVGRHALADIAAITTLLAIGVLAFGPVLAWTAGLRAGAVGVMVALDLALLASWRRWSGLTTMNVGVIAYLLFGGVAALPETTVAGAIPTLDTLRRLAQLTYAAWRDLLTASLPASTFIGPAVVPYLAALLLGTLAYWSALRGARPLLAVPTALALLVVGILWGTQQAPYALAQGLAFAAIALTWAAWRAQRRTGRGTTESGAAADGAVFHDVRRAGMLGPQVAAVAGLLVLGIAVAAAAAPALTPQVRHVLRDDVVPPLEPSQYPSPLTRYRHLERDLAAEPLLTAVGLPAGARVRIATMDAFDGNVYRVDAASAGFQRAGEHIDSATGLDGPTATVTITVSGLTGEWVPTVGATRGVRFGGPRAGALADGLHYNPLTGTAISPAGIGADTTYALDAVIAPRPADAAIAAAVPANAALPAPQKVPGVLRDVTARAVGPATSPAEQLTRIRDFLRAGYYSDGSTSASPAGHTSARIASLLTQPALVGDEEQYAVTMALMARELGLPARVVLGFVPPSGTTSADAKPPAQGTAPTQPKAPASVTFTGADARVWVEVAFEGLGWVSYDPTPDRSKVPRTIEPKPKEEPKPQVLPPPEPPRESAPPPVKADESDRPADPVVDSSPLARILAVTGAVLGGLLLLAAPALLILAVKAVRRRRRRTAGSAADRIGHGWSEVVDRATDLGAPIPPRATRRETAAVIHDRYPAASSVALADRIDAHVFGRGEPTEHDVHELWQQVEEALARVSAAVPARQRWAGRLSLRSLRSLRFLPSHRRRSP